MRVQKLLTAFPLLLLLAVPAAGQVASAILVEGGDLPGGPIGHTIGAINNSGVNNAGGFAFTVNSTDGVLTSSHVWGSADGMLPGAPLFSEGTYGIYEQVSFESFFGIADDGRACYSPSCINTDTGADGLDSAWLNETVVAIEEDPYPHDIGFWWSFASRPGVTANGNPHFVGGLTDTQGGSTQIRGLFYGPAANPLLLGGVVISGPELPVADTGIDFDYRISAFGTNWISPVMLATGSTANDGYVLINGDVIMAGGSIVAEESPVPEAIGGLPGELWDNFDFCGINEEGDWLLTGDTSAATFQDEFVMLNGEILLREGMMIDGYTLNGAIEGGFLNEDGDWAVVWDIDFEAVNIEALIFNGRIVLMENEPVDFDGDGEVETTSLLTNFTGISALTLGDRDEDGRVKLYFTADVETAGAARTQQFEPVLDLAAAGLEAPLEPRDSRIELEGGFVLEAGTATGADPAPAAGHVLGANYPNPFNPSTRIDFSLSTDAETSLDVLTVDGRHVATLIAGKLGAGEHSVTWRGLDDAGSAMASGIYLYRLQVKDWQESKAMVLLK